MENTQQNKPPYIIAETAYSFQGEQNYLEQQISCLQGKNIDCIKFHLIFDQYSYAVKDFTVLHEHFDTWILDREVWKTLLLSCKAQDLDTLLLVDDVESVEFCRRNVELVDAIEVHAACVNDLDILDAALRFAADFDKVFYIGVSGFEYQELSAIIEYIRAKNVNRVVLMYGFQNFPTKLEEINLSRLEIIRQSFGFEVAYADHTRYDDVNKENLIYTAYALGARVLEIHYVLEEGVERIDHITALDATHLDTIKQRLDRIHQSVGHIDFRLNEGEKKYLNFRKVPVYARNMKAGQVLKPEDVSQKRVEKPERQHKFREIESLYGKTLNKNIKADTELLTGDLDD